MDKLIFCIDFDGTIVENEYPNIGGLNLAVASFIKNLKEKGHIFILWTCRCDKDLQDAVDFLKKNEIAPDFVNENADFRKELFGNDTRKVYADYYIDDKNPGGVVIPWDALEG